MMCEGLRQVVGDGLALRVVGAVLRVLEIGGGTGGLTHGVLPVLGELGIAVVYVFTDIGAMFLSRAEEEFGARYPWVRYGILDIEKSGVEQGYEAGGFDLVLAVNVLHATRDIGETMRRVGELMGRGAVLMLLEVVDPPALGDMAFGMTSGWWAWAENGGDGVRRDHACMSVEQWERVLKEAGFERTVGVSGWDAADQAVIVSQYGERAPVEGAVKLQGVGRKWTVVHGGGFDEVASGLATGLGDGVRVVGVEEGVGLLEDGAGVVVVGGRGEAMLAVSRAVIGKGLSGVQVVVVSVGCMSGERVDGGWENIGVGRVLMNEGRGAGVVVRMIDVGGVEDVEAGRRRRWFSWGKEGRGGGGSGETGVCMCIDLCEEQEDQSQLTQQ